MGFEQSSMKETNVCKQFETIKTHSDFRSFYCFTLFTKIKPLTVFTEITLIETGKER